MPQQNNAMPQNHLSFALYKEFFHLTIFFSLKLVEVYFVSLVKNPTPIFKSKHEDQTWNTSKAININNGKFFESFQRKSIHP